MKKSVIFMILLVLVIPISYAIQIEIPETFNIEKEESEQKIDSEGGVTSYFYAENKLIASKDSNGIKYLYQDRLGSDINSKQLPFGQVIKESENRFSFTGKELDEELYYFGARYYDSNTGRFTSVDPIEDQPPYQYVRNNPMNLVDPTGTQTEPNEATLRGWNIGISAAFPMLKGIFRGDPIGDIAKNTFYGALSGLGSFEVKRYVGGHAEHPLEFLGAGIAEDIFGSVRSNAMENKPMFEDLTFNYLIFSFRLRDGIEPGINLAKTWGAIEFASTEGNKFDFSHSLLSGVPTFTRDSYGTTPLTGSGIYAGMSSSLGGAISYTTNDGHAQTYLRHEFIHNLQTRSVSGIMHSSGLNQELGLFGFRLHGLENVEGWFLGQELPALFYNNPTGYYESNWAWNEREAHGLTAGQH